MRFFSVLLAAILCCALAPIARSQASGQQLFTEAQRAFLAGDYDTAKVKFAAVLEMNPKHQGAQNYLRMIRVKEAQSGGNPQQRALEGLILPEVKFKDASLSSALEYVKQQVSRASNGQTQVNFVAQLPPETLAQPVSLSLSNVPVSAVLSYLGDLAGVTFEIERYAVVVKPKAAPAAAAASDASVQ